MRIVIIVIFNIIFHQVLYPNSYIKHCIPCHNKIYATLQDFFMYSLKKYSSKRIFIKKLKIYFRNPQVELSSMSKLFLSQITIKKPLKITDGELNDALNIYWEKYKIIDKLR